MAKNKPKILFATAEVAPFSKAGGLGDVAGTLPPALLDIGADIRIITPLYGSIDRKEHRVRKVGGSEMVQLAAGDQLFDVRYLRANLPGTKVQVFFVECDELFDRPGIYSDPETGEAYHDNPVRFILFSKAVIEFMKQGIFSPDVLHINENQTALIAPLLRTRPEHQFLAQTPILLSVHNAEYQGNYSMEHLHQSGLDPSLAGPGGHFEFYGAFNFLKAGLMYANKINTVSETYAKETMSSPDFGFGLEGVLRARKDDYFGIINGVDYSAWDPAKDPYLPKNYNSGDLSGKCECKRVLLEKFGFEDVKQDRPVIGMVSRLVYQKGIDLLLGVLPEVLSHNVYVCILGTGQSAYQEGLQHIGNQYPGKMSVKLTFNEELAHLIEAGSDMFVMPSRFEPCGLNQLYSLRYGTLPIVRNTGGLADTVQDYDPESGDGWGFVFQDYSTDAFSAAIARALRTYNEPKQWKKLMQRAMALDYSWKRSADRYLEVYRDLMDG